ncbi:MAG: beta-xylosidase [Microcoleaceae cyanobacterium]
MNRPKTNFLQRLHRLNWRQLKFTSKQAIAALLSIGTAIFIFCWGHLPVFGQQQATVTIDFGASQTGLFSASGFLYGIGDGNKPPDNVITPLQPKFWRTSKLQHYPRLQKLGGTFQLQLSDNWGYAGKNPWPYKDYAKWEAHVRKVAQQNKDKKMIWDVWNEPDLKDPFWAGSRKQFFETYKRTYRILRQELGPNAIIGGPSIAKYDKGFLKDFLNYCKDNQLEVNFLSWHELNDQDITSIASHIKDARERFQKNSDYQSLKIKKLYVNEIVGPTAQYRPAEILGYLYYTEQGRADGACKACWEPVGGGRNNCFNNSLDGLVTPDTGQPRAAWWVYRAYADGFKTRVKTQLSHPRVVALASGATQNKPAQILLGYFEQGVTAPQANVTVVIKNLQKLSGFQPGKPMALVVERIPNSGEKVVQNLAQVKQEQITVNNEVLRLTIPNVKLHEVYRLTIR